MDVIAVFDQAMGAATPCTTAWEEVGLSNLRQGLDEQAMTIAENQESSLQNRKALATQAKSFRVALEEELEADSDIRASSGSLVRAFKSEIDALTTRSRFAEGAFLNLYKLLREAPDPAVAVQALAEAAKDAVAALEERNRVLEKQTQELTAQVEALRTTVANTRGASLSFEELQEERRALKAEVAAEQAEQEQLRLQALQDAVQEELLHAQRQAEHERVAGQAQLQVVQAEVERLEMKAALFEEEAGRTGRLEEEARAREEQLRALRDQVSSLELERETLSERAVAAVESERRAKTEVEDVQERLRNAEGGLGNRVKQLEEERARLRKEVDMGADALEVEAMREKIRILEGIWGGGSGARGGQGGRDEPEGFGDGDGDGGDAMRRRSRQATSQRSLHVGDLGAQGDEDEHEEDEEDVIPWEDDQEEEGEEDKDQIPAKGDVAGGDDDAGASGSPAEKRVETMEACSERTGPEGEKNGAEQEEESRKEREDGLDAWLISYNARLRKELERLRVRAREAEERLQEVEKEREAEGAELVEAQQDVKRLEQDLVDAHQVVEAGKTMLRAFQSGAVAKQFGKLVGRGAGGMGAFGRRSEVAGDDRGGINDVLEEAEAGDMAEAEGFSAADRLLGAVKRQRERFKKEALRREREASISKANAEQLSLANQDLRRENVHLYKKIRFLMSYGERGTGLEGGSGSSTAAERSTERKYERLYEDELDPFKEFDSQEKAARRGQMGVLERWLLWASGAVLRNRCRRHLLLVYLLGVHLMLFFMPRLGIGGGGGVYDDRFGGVMVQEGDAPAAAQ